MTPTRRIIMLAALLLPILFLAGWSACLAWRHNHAPSYQVAIEGYDPRDIVYGKYIMFRYKWDDAESAKPDTKDLPTDGRFYVPEYDAYDLQTMLQDRNINHFKVDVVLAGKNGYVKNMTINGLPWQQALDAWRQTQQNKPK